MKRIFGLIAVLAAFSLTACMGGGSGGGGGGTGATPFSNPPLTLSKATGGATQTAAAQDGFANVASQGTKDALADSGGIDLGGGFTLHEGSLELRYENNVVATFATGEDGEIELYDNGFMITDLSTIPAALKDAISDSADFEDKEGSHTNLTMDYHGKRTLTFNGNISYTHQAVALNAAVPLEHSVYGAWIMNTNYKGNINDGDITRDVDFNLSQANTFARHTDGAVAINPASNEAFTGKSVAFAYAPGDNFVNYKEAILYGDVALNISADASRASASFTFPGYYKIDYNNLVVTQNPGEVNMINGITQIAVDNSLGTTGPGKDFAIDASRIDPNTDNTYLGGKFYQNSKGYDKEAVGEFGVRDQGGNGVYGSFGVVKQ